MSSWIWRIRVLRRGTCLVRMFPVYQLVTLVRGLRKIRVRQSIGLKPESSDVLGWLHCRFPLFHMRRLRRFHVGLVFSVKWSSKRHKVSTGMWKWLTENAMNFFERRPSFSLVARFAVSFLINVIVCRWLNLSVFSNMILFDCSSDPCYVGRSHDARGPFPPGWNPVRPRNTREERWRFHGSTIQGTLSKVGWNQEFLVRRFVNFEAFSNCRHTKRARHSDHERHFLMFLFNFV